MPYTSSPGAKPVTSGATASTTPDMSVPGTSGNSSAGRSSGGMTFMPSRRYQSGGLTPTARTRTRTSPEPIAGTGTSSYRRTSGPPASWNWIAFITLTPVAFRGGKLCTSESKPGTAAASKTCPATPSCLNGIARTLEG